MVGVRALLRVAGKTITRLSECWDGGRFGSLRLLNNVIVVVREMQFAIVILYPAI